MAAKVSEKNQTLSKKSEKSRQLPKPQYKTFKLQPRIKKPHDPLPKARVLFKDSLCHLWQYRKSFIGITIVYLALTIVLVKGLSSTAGDINEIKAVLEETFTGVGGQIATGVTVFGYLLGGSTGTTSDSAGVYQLIVIILSSLALIWALRQTHANTRVGVREAFYKGMYPLVPFFVVLLVIGLQSIPIAVGSWLFSATVVSGIAVTAIEQVLWSLLCFLLVLLSVYLITSSIFALYISTLPDMTPMKALRSARQLVLYRRWEVMRKVMFLPLILLIIGVIIIVPVILFLAPVAEWVFFVFSMTVLAVSHSYLYGLYRKLL